MTKEIFAKAWTKNGKHELTREEWPDFDAGEFHRLDGPAIEYSDGSKVWCVNGKTHRLDGPAIEHIDGRKFWCVNGELHRLDGPAIEYSNGTKYWYRNGHLLDTDEVEEWLSDNEVDLSTEEGQMAFKIRFS